MQQEGARENLKLRLWRREDKNDIVRRRSSARERKGKETNAASIWGRSRCQKKEVVVRREKNTLLESSHIPLRQDGLETSELQEKRTSYLY